MEKNIEAYKNYVCPYCFYTLDKCDCEVFPPYSLMFIDSGIQEHIRVLNQKGYKTIGCCESHYKGVCVCVYISFAMDYGFGKTIKIPEGFRFQKSKNAIMYEFKSNVMKHDMNKEKKIKLEKLLKWCYDLPNIK